ncbi:MAG: hypothetical protein Q9170_006091 [Blastenia crenularia]
MPGVSLYLSALLIFLITILPLSNHVLKALKPTGFLPSHTKSSSPVNDSIPYTTDTTPILLTTPSLPLTPFPQPHHPSLLERTVSEPFQCLVAKGDKYYNQGVLPAFSGSTQYPPPDFGPEENVLQDSGWTSFSETKPLPKYWTDAIKKTKGKIPKAGVEKIYLGQSKEFTNEFGKQEATFAQYNGLYIPSNNAIIMTLTNSPRYKIGTRRGMTPDAIPSHLPRINQLSDLVWYTWTGKSATPGTLRYYAVEGVVNPDAKALILEIFQARRGTIDVP